MIIACVCGGAIEIPLLIAACTGAAGCVARVIHQCRGKQDPNGKEDPEDEQEVSETTRHRTTGGDPSETDVHD